MAAGCPVKLGLEVDYVPGREEETRELLAPYPWDYLLGSLHYIGELGVDGMSLGWSTRWASRKRGGCTSRRSRRLRVAGSSTRCRIPIS